jgi:hypothetical protein
MTMQTAYQLMDEFLLTMQNPVRRDEGFAASVRHANTSIPGTHAIGIFI